MRRFDTREKGALGYDVLREETADHRCAPAIVGEYDARE
jgi:hypothetical protein